LLEGELRVPDEPAEALLLPQAARSRPHVAMGTARRCRRMRYPRIRQSTVTHAARGSLVGALAPGYQLIKPALVAGVGAAARGAETISPGCGRALNPLTGSSPPAHHRFIRTLSPRP